MNDTVLLTAAIEDSEQIRQFLEAESVDFIHAPLEKYVRRSQAPEIDDILNRLDEFENIIYGKKRNARFFMQEALNRHKLEAVKARLNLTIDEATFSFLENKGIPAVHPQKEERPVDLLEIMLRLRRTGKSLYPCGSHQAEELPGLLKELDIPVTELELFNLKGPTEKQLAVYQKKITENPPDIIIFHSRRSVNRIITAFPELDFSEAKIISADSGITEKLTGKGISVDAEAEGSWESVASLLL